MRQSTRRPSLYSAQRHSKVSSNTFSCSHWPILSTGQFHLHSVNVMITTTHFLFSWVFCGSLATLMWSLGSHMTFAMQWTWNSVSFQCSCIHSVLPLEISKSSSISTWHLRPLEMSSQIKKSHWLKLTNLRFSRWLACQVLLGSCTPTFQVTQLSSVMSQSSSNSPLQSVSFSWSTQSWSSTASRPVDLSSKWM